jgi:sulfide:quinone oxidoreductase
VSDPRQPTGKVVICGGGVASLETVLALRAHLRIGVEALVVAPNRQFVYQPLAAGAPFDLAETYLLDLAEIAEDQGAKLLVDSLTAVDTERRDARLASGARIPYDALVVAVGAPRRHWLQGALHFGGATSVAAFRVMLEHLEQGKTRLVTFVNPTGPSWTLLLYELALLTASRLNERGLVGARLTVTTPEPDPLSVFGPAASRMLRGVLADRGVALRVGVHAERIEGGKLYLQQTEALEVDRVITLPELVGPDLPGLPCDADGFILVDPHSRVVGSDHVYAAGDATTFPLKHGGIAAQQADAAAEEIAAQFGAPLTPAPVEPTIRGTLLTGVAPTYLRATGAEPAGWADAMAETPLWWPPTEIAARYLGPYLSRRDASTRPKTLTDRSVAAKNRATLQASHDEAREMALRFAGQDAADCHFSSALGWLEVVERLDGVLPPGYQQRKSDWQERARESGS